MPTRLIVGLSVLLTLGCDSGTAPKGASSGAPAAKSAASSAPPAATAPAGPPPPPSDVPSAAVSANLTMEGATVDGLVMKTISCRAPGANPFTAIQLLAPLAKHKEALDACVSEAVEVRVHFDAKDKKATDVRVAGAPDAKAATCVAKMIEAAEWGANMACVLAVSLKAPAKK